MNNGWIKLHRKLLENPIFQRSQYVHLWVALLLLANHDERKMMWNGGIIVIHEGQFVTGRKKLAELTGIPEGTIEDILKWLETQQQIRQQKTNKYRLVTILNWKEYQHADTKSNNKATTSRQQADTNKNDKNVKNDKKDTLSPAIAEGGGGTSPIEKIYTDGGFTAFWEEYPRKTGKGATAKAWKAARITPAMVDKVLAAVKGYKQTEQWKREGGRFIPYPATFINQRRFDDEPSAPSSEVANKYAGR
jgi:hypothetical protein